MAGGGEYDWWAAAGHPEHLRPLNDAGNRMFEDPVLREARIVVFSSGVDLEREVVELEVAAGDPAAARELIERRYGLRVDLVSVAPSEYVGTAIAWDWWQEAGDGILAIDVWVDACVDEAGLPIQLVENSVEIVVALRGAVYQGIVTADYAPRPTRVELESPVGRRRVIDGTTGRRGSTRPQL